MMEKDFVVVRKSFELLVCLCSTCGTFLKKRTMDEIFPKLSTLLSNLAMESEQVANKNRKVYTYSQSYKLQLTVLEVSCFEAKPCVWWFVLLLSFSFM